MKRIVFSITMIFVFQVVTAQTYDLLGPKEDVKDMTTESLFTSAQTDMKTQLKEFNFEMDGQMTDVLIIIKSIVTPVDERLVKYKLEREQGSYNITLDGKTSKERDKSPITGKEIEFVKARNKWSLKNPKKFNKKQLEVLNGKASAMKAYLFPLDSLFPKSVKVGDSWEVRNEGLLPIAGAIEDEISGTATCILKTIETTDEDVFAIIEFDGNYSFKEVDFVASYQLKGTIKRSIKNYDSYKLESEGIYTTETDVVEKGMRATVKSKGDCNYKLYRKYTFK